MSRCIYTAGYSGHKPEDLKAIAEQLGATVCDIRYAPYSRRPDWNRSRLEPLLGERYAWIKALGNVNYKGDHGDAVMLLDEETGIALLEDMSGVLILLCVCSGKDTATCHRQDVARSLRARGHSVQELDWDIVSSPTLF